jgi:translocation and assembly module TamB
MTSPDRNRVGRRWPRLVFALLFVGAILFASLPWVLRWQVVQRRLSIEANKILAPGSVSFSAIRLSWFQPTEIFSLVLRDAQGEPVVAAPRARFQWNLWQILFRRPKSATLTIEKGDLDIERFADGTVDLYETLRPVISEYPPIRLVIRVENGRLRFRDPAMPEPVVAGHARVDLDLGRLTGPITWKIQLANGKAPEDSSHLEIVGDYSRALVDSKGRHDLTLSLKGSRWPWTLANSVIQSSGEFSGLLGVQVRGGRFELVGDATVTNLVGIGQVLSSDTIHLETVHALWKANGGDDSWTIERLELTSPIGSLKGEGTLPPRHKQGAWIEGAVDLAAFAKQLPATLRLRDDLRVERGSATLRADAQLKADGRTEEWTVAGKVAGLIARQGDKTLRLPEPATLSAKLQRSETELTLERFDAQTSFLSATGQGDLNRGISLTATLDLAAFGERCCDWIDIGHVELAGQAKLDAGYRRDGVGYRAEASAAFLNLRLAGLPLIEKFERRELNVDGQVSGRAAPSGLPVDWKAATMRARTGPTEINLQANADGTTGEVALAGKARVQLAESGRHERLEGELNAKSQGDIWAAHLLALALVRDSKRGPGIGPAETIRWETRGR